ncbi:hypothetical protein CDL12_25205 [Handroanthus impetiginosus]|uniref:Uncharacterized protein n=1 Tax=Handroanthus impetiginosus TaxID=429701 RepID=A0A2G9GBC5_9LAMI|nr:hypothetical protein CDL12_25205 [Handroanthus impetiginosus]
MSENQVRRCWEERVISTEKGNRVVHYYLMDATANCLLAVVGRERSLRHMTYSVTEDFLTVFGSSSSAHAGTRWQSRKEVSKFLQSVTSRGGSLFADSSENKFFTVKRKDIRMSKDWIDNKWVDIKAKPDILSILTSFLNPPLQLPPLPPLAELQAKMKVPSSSKDGGSQDAKLLQVPSSSTSSGNKKAVEDLHLEQLLLIKKNEDWSRKSSGKDENDGKKAKTAMDTSGQPTNVKH